MKPVAAITAGAICLIGATLAAEPVDAPSFSGGDGSAQDKAVLIHAVSERQGIRAEHMWVNEHLPGGKFVSQSLVAAAGRKYDVIGVLKPDGVTQSVYFDISEYFGNY